MTSNQQEKQSILILGATGGTGVECIRHFAKHSSQPNIHAFCRNPSKLSDADRALCTSVIQGDAREAKDLQNALQESAADVVIVSIGTGGTPVKTDVRTASAKALVTVLKLPKFKHVRAVVVSSIGAGTSSMIIGMGLGKLLSFYLRHALEDHSGQEAAFDSLRDRTTIVRPTGLSDNAATGNLVEFGDMEKAPTYQTDRADVATWIVQEVCDETKPVSGRIVNITSAKK